MNLIIKTIFFKDVTLKLLAYNIEEIQEEVYRLCHKKISSAIGIKLNTSKAGAPGSQILFMIRSKILIEIAGHGLTSDNLKVGFLKNIFLVD